MPSAADIHSFFANNPKAFAVGHAISVSIFRPMLSERKDHTGLAPEVDGDSSCFAQSFPGERSKIKEIHGGLKGHPWTLSNEVATRAILEDYITWVVHVT